MSVLADVSIREEIAAGRVVLDPFDPANIQPASVDVRLGAEFRVHRNWKASHIDPFEPNTELMEAMTIGGEYRCRNVSCLGRVARGGPRTTPWNRRAC